VETAAADYITPSARLATAIINAEKKNGCDVVETRLEGWMDSDGLRKKENF